MIACSMVTHSNRKYYIVMGYIVHTMINIPECEYVIGRYNQFCQYDNTINLYLQPDHELTDTELDTYICDCITHEYIHHILESMFHQVVTYLFDCIGDTLRENISLLRKIVKHRCRKYNTHTELWSDIVNRDGLKGLMNCYTQLNINEVLTILLKGC